MDAARRHSKQNRLAFGFDHGPGFMGISAVLLSLHSHLTDSGLSAMRASSVVAAMTLPEPLPNRYLAFSLITSANNG